MRWLFFVLLFFGTRVDAKAQGSSLLTQRFSCDTVQFLIDDITRELSVKHPGFYRYTSKQNFDHFIDSVKNTVTDSLTLREIYLKVKPVVANIRCLHTGFSFPETYINELNEKTTVFPFQVYFIDEKALVIKNFSSDTSIRAGDEINQINGEEINSIVSRIFPLMCTDGNGLAMKYRYLYFWFPSFYRHLQPVDKYTITTKREGAQTDHDVKGVKAKDIAQNGFLTEPVRDKQLEFTVENNVGILTIRSFAKSDIKKAGQSFKKFIGRTFATLHKQNIRNLIVDIRDNTGGTDANAAYFTRHFFDSSFRYWDRIEVTKAISDEIKGFFRVFFKKPVYKDSTWLWRKGKLTREFDFYQKQTPAKNNYKGKTYVLINGYCMSSCSDVAAVLSDQKKGIFIGEETGGCYQGNNSGMMPTISLPPFGFRLSVPLQKYTNHVDPDKNVGRGTIPEHVVKPTVEDLLNGNDRALRFAFSLIENNALNFAK